MKFGLPPKGALDWEYICTGCEFEFKHLLGNLFCGGFIGVGCIENEKGHLL